MSHCLEKVVNSLRHHLVQGPQSEILCLLGPNPQQSDDLTIQIAAQLLYQILNHTEPGYSLLTEVITQFGATPTMTLKECIPL